MFDIFSEVSSHTRESFFIHGDWVKPDGARRVAIVHPASEEALAEVPLADASMARQTIAAARTAFQSCSVCLRLILPEEVLVRNWRGTK